MKFMNTDGMAFIGPGSEWFWTALQFTALAITFIAIYRQLRAQHLQMHENTKVLRSQAHYNALSLLDRPWELLIENVELAEIVTMADATPDASREADWARYSAYSWMQSCLRVRTTGAWRHCGPMGRADRLATQAASPCWSRQPWRHPRSETESCGWPGRGHPALRTRCRWRGMPGLPPCFWTTSCREPAWS